MASLNKVWIFCLAIFLLASPLAQVVRCQSDTNDAAETTKNVSDLGIVGDDVQDFGDGGFPSLPGIDTICLFPKNSAKCCISSAIIDKYISESARLIREMFGYARDHQPCIIFMDEIDAIGGRRFIDGTRADREIQRTLMELLNQLDGFDQLGKVEMIMATNRPDVALLQPGRLDRKIEIPLPNELSKMEILKIHAAGIAKHGEIDYEVVVKFAEVFNGADLQNVCTEAGMSTIFAERDYVIHEGKDFSASKV